MESSEQKRGGVTLKAVSVGLVFVLIEAWLVHFVDQIIHGTLSFHLVPAPAMIVLLFVLVWGINTPLRALRPGLALTTRELLVVYTMMAVGLTPPSMGLAQVLVCGLAAPAYYASPANKFTEIFRLGTDEVIPSWIAPTDYDAIKGLFARTSTAPIDWGMVARTWAAPLTAWGLWFFVLFFVFICMMSILRKQWVKNEQLTFAYNVVPEAMSAVPEAGKREVLSPFWKNKWMWVGFLIPFAYHFFANLYVISPAFPRIPFDIFLTPYFTEFPWNGIGDLRICISFHAVAFCMLLTEEMLFSMWFFWLVNKVTTISLYALGWSQTYSHFNSPAMADQATGGFLAYFFIILWAMRTHLKVVASRAARFRTEPDEADEPLTYRTAFWGLILGVAGLVGFLWVAGANPFWSFVIISVTLMYWVVLARLVAEAGVFMSQGPWPVHEVVAKAVGTHLPFLSAAGSVKTWTLLGFLKSVTLKWYTIMPAYILGGFKFADRQKINARRLVFAMLLAIFVSIVAGFVISIYLDYSYGALNLSEWKAGSLALQPFAMIRSYENAPKGADLKSLMVMGVGAVVTLFLSAMRLNFAWWPFHPLGYIASNLYIIHYFWIHIFLGWVGVKLITKYGGVHLLRRIRPFLIGMVLGGFMSGGFWWILDYVYHLDSHWVYSV